MTKSHAQCPDPAPTTASGAIDPRLCPLCGQPNLCAQELERATGQAQPPCWCTQATFSAALLARVPEEARRKACVCARCAQS